MGITYLGGAIAIDKAGVKDAKKAPFLGMCVVTEDDDVVFEPRSLADLRIHEERYDSGVWFFTLELHDDDLPNANFEPLRAFLQSLPSTPGAGFVASRESWKDTADWMMGFIGTQLIEKSVVDAPFYASLSDDERSTYVAQSDLPALLDQLTWAPAREVFRSV